MPGGFIRKEPSDSKKLRETPEVVGLFNRAKWMTFCDKIQGHDDEITEEFLRSLQPKSKKLETVNFRGLTLKLTPQLISRVTDFPLGCPGIERKGNWARRPKRNFSYQKNSFQRIKMRSRELAYIHFGVRSAFRLWNTLPVRGDSVLYMVITSDCSLNSGIRWIYPQNKS